MLLNNYAEGGVDGATVTTGNSGGPSGQAWDAVTIGTGAAIVYDDEHAYGTMAYKFTSGSTGTFVAWTAGSVGTVAEAWGREYVYLTAHPTGGEIALVRLRLGTTQTARIVVTTAGKLMLRNSANSIVATSTTSVATGQWIRIEWHCIPLAVDGTIEARLFNDADSDTLTEAIGSSTAALTAGLDAVNWGPVGAIPGETFWLDNLQINNTGWPGGPRHAFGAVTITATSGLQATGTKHADGGAAVTGTAALAAGGRPSFPSIGPPPRPRVRWQLVAGPATGGHAMQLTTAKSRRLTFRLTGQHEISFTLRGRHPEALALDELATDVHALWTPDEGPTRILARCRTGNTGDDLDADGHRVSVTALDYRALLGRRILYATSPLVHSGVEQANVVWALVADTQGRPGGDLGIAKGWTAAALTGITVDVAYTAGDAIGDRIDELSESLDGFDWDITPTSASGLRLDIWHPERGTSRGAVLEYGGLVAKARREVNPGDYANAIYMTGADGLTAQELAAGDVASAPQGRWDKAYGDSGLTTQPMLNARAAWQLDHAQVVRPTWTVTLKPGAWDGPDHLWLGDRVRLVVRSGRLNVNTVQRIHEIAISLDDSTGGETVELALGGPKPDPRRRPALVDRRLTNLERR